MKMMKKWLSLLLCGVLLLSTGGLFAAFAVGYADEAPAARPRKALEETVVWRI